MKQFFEQLFNAPTEKESADSHQHQIQLITATLLIEISKADFSQDTNEIQRINVLLKNHFQLSQAEAISLTELAQEHSDQLTSLQHLTRELNETISQQDKVEVIELMWQVVYADGEKDRYEEHLMRKVADLLYVAHSDFIKARHKAEI
ncbi:MAG: TerB family tellurite resistance protein [Gammaproteobacteria bacterium]|nr:TerB family tellurite resistance protein [Gammaproteobacteria bacterium]